MTVSQIIARERSRLRFALIARGVALALAIGFALLAVSTIALGDARWITRPSAPLGAWLVVAVVLATLVWWSWREARRRASAAAIAAAIERERALRSGSLRGALEVHSSGSLGQLAARRMAAELSKTRRPLAPATQGRATRWGIISAAVALGSLASVAVARDMAPDGWRAMRHPMMAWSGSLLPPLIILDPPRYVLRGEEVRVNVAAPERRTLVLHARATGRPWAEQTLPVERGTATVVLGPVDADLALVATDGRAASDTVIIQVTDRPFVGDVAINATYPAYLRRAPEVLAVGEPLRLPRGTALHIRGRASTALRSVALAREGDTIHLAPDGHAFGGRFTAQESGRWTWQASGAQGTIADVPAALELTVLADSSPRVEILAPRTDTIVAPTDRIELRAEATDDHGIGSVVLRSWRRPASGASLPEVTQTLAAPAEPRWLGTIPLDLAPRGLQPGDELRLVVVATDDSPWRQNAESRELILRVPTLAERREMARELADSTASRAAAAAKSQRQLERRTEDAARARGRRDQRAASGRDRDSRGRQDRAMDYEAAEQAEALAKEQRELAEQVEKLRQDARALEKQLREAGALDTSLSRQLREAQELLKDALTPELAAQLEELSRAAQQLSRDDTRRALENLKEQQERLRKQLERSAEMLKRAALEGTMQTLRDEARELAQQQRATADSMARGSQAGEKGKELSDRSRRLAEAVEKLAQKLEQENAEAGPPKLEQAADEARRSADAMNQAARQQSGAQQGKSAQQAAAQRGAEGAREASEHMEQAAQQLSEAREGQIQEWKNELTGELDRAIQEMIQMAREQEALAQKARQGAEQGQLRAEQGALQQGVERVGEKVEKAGQRSTHVSPQAQGAVAEARRRVQQATERTAESQRGGSDAAPAMQEAAQALNRAAAALVKDREQVGQAETASGFAEMLERMREMAKQQGSLNAQAQGLLPMPGQRMSAQGQAQARGIAEQQRNLADRLDEAGQNSSSGRASELAREMRQIAEALDAGRVDQTLIERQQRLFRRLLDAGLTLEKEERDDRGERESRSATGAEGTFTPPAEVRSAPTARYREPTWSELRGLTAEERRAVIEYFKRINAASERP
ncbi:MAG: hypothetical protein ACT4PJ_16870 [Gemmatimonadaceae bacterium]